jgi:phytoene synthase
MCRGLSFAMDPGKYCEQKVARSGSDLYYALLSLPPAQRSAIAAAHALRSELADVVEKVSDAGLSRIKLDWWRREIEQLRVGSPSHPVTRSLWSAVGEATLPVEPLRRMIDATEADLARPTFPSFAELERHCRQTAGSLQLWCAELLGYDHRQTRSCAERLGIAMELADRLCSVRDDVRRGRLYLPQDKLAELRIDPGSLAAASFAAPAVRELFHLQAERARDLFRSALQSLPPQDRYRQRSGTILAALRRELLDEIEADGYRILEHRIELTAVRKLWIGWKTERRERLAQRLRDKGLAR